MIATTKKQKENKKKQSKQNKIKKVEYFCLQNMEQEKPEDNTLQVLKMPLVNNKKEIILDGHKLKIHYDFLKDIELETEKDIELAKEQEVKCFVEQDFVLKYPKRFFDVLYSVFMCFCFFIAIFLEKKTQNNRKTKKKKK